MSDKHSARQDREDILEGRNPVYEALKSGRQVDKILVAKGERHGSIVRILALAKQNRILVSEVERKKLDSLSQTGAHQGVIAYVASANYVSVEDILKGAAAKGDSPFVIVCDSLNDAHNLGSIVRSADCFGAHGVIIPKHRSVGLSAVAAKSSAGAIEYVPVAKVTNLAQTIDSLKKSGLWVYGTDADAPQPLFQADLKGPTAIVIGSEGEGMTRLVKEKCDFLVSIPLVGNISSLNASVAAGILMYEAARQRGSA